SGWSSNRKARQAFLGQMRTQVGDEIVAQCPLRRIVPEISPLFGIVPHVVELALGSVIARSVRPAQPQGARDGKASAAIERAGLVRGADHSVAVQSAQV